MNAKLKIMNAKLISSIIMICLLVACKKEDENAISYQIEVEHISTNWKVQTAFKNSTGNESDNTEDVGYDWNNWRAEFWNNNTYKITEYSPDSTSSTIETGTWQLDFEGKMLLKGSKDLIEFSSGLITNEGSTEKYWIRKKNEDNQFWVWIEESYYGSTGVFLKLIPS